MPVYIGKIGDLVGCYRCLTSHRQQNSATQFVYSIKFKLSRAIYTLHKHIDVNCVNTKRICLHSRAFSNTNKNAPQALNTFQTVSANQQSLMDIYCEKK